MQGVPAPAFIELQPPGQSHEDLEIMELKLASAIRVQPVAFDPATYQIEDPIAYKDEVRFLT